MEEESQSTGYWCYECSRAVETIMEVETVKCSLCHGGFVEELDISRSDNRNHHHQQVEDFESNNALSLWAPVLLGMMNNPRRTNRARRFRQIEPGNVNDPELNRESQMVVRRRRRSSTTILQLLQGARNEMIREPYNNNDNNNSNNNNNNDTERERERVFVINPFNQRIIVQGAGGGRNSFGSGGSPQNQPIGSLGDYFVGPDMELLLQHLTENNPTRYGTPPAQKKAVETMPTVKIKVDLDNFIQCSVCLEDFEGGNEAKEMPCKHKFHGECIVTWLDLHSTCPVCRYQLPSDESKLKHERESSRGSPVNRLTGPESESGELGLGGDMVGRNERQISVTFPWPFNSLFINPSVSLGSGSGSGPTSQDGGGGNEDDH
ncbi:hypothetical protein M8C21_030551 [Ambrosia artemisiifolia]|uniref:RING-type E3 ubiquitin transferase n=1 Tax=Ambrosia artemisiifolia TaxID=4212 RepID=A0AAD5GGD1_AMBAR|nr:hypothetical protein M8C21_030551 [Ambrosia artemisiifolia]